MNESDRERNATMNLKMNFRIKKAAIKVLRKELGWKQLLGLVRELSKNKKRGEPWKDLPAPVDRKEEESRELIGDAILLYRALLKKRPQPEAERIIREVIVESAVMQLYSLVPRFSKERINELPAEERKEKFCSLINQFPNADWEINKISEQEYSYFITRCRLVELIIAVGHPELQDAFCEGDGVYFERYQTDINFSRPTKIGSGDDVCDFVFRIDD